MIWRRLLIDRSLMLACVHDIAGKEQGFDVVLIDTAGRMQDNEPLMRALAKVSRET